VNDTTLIYVGSSIEPYLSTRFNKHKYQENCSLYTYINNPENNTKWSDWYIELYEEYPCENKLQLVKRENEIIRELATINKIGYRTQESIKEYNRQYREKNKDHIQERYKKYFEKNKEKIWQKKQEYNDNHKEHKNNYMKERYKVKKEEIKEYQKERRNKEENRVQINCECGSCIFKYKLADHLKTKKHLNYIASL
jgi:hypothetical protein